MAHFLYIQIYTAIAQNSHEKSVRQGSPRGPEY